MPKIVYILVLLIVASCRVAAIAAPLVEHSSFTLAEWHNEQCNNEENEMEKVKQESKEDPWLAQVNLVGYSVSVSRFIVFSDNNLLEHTRKPVSPPPNVA